MQCVSTKTFRFLTALKNNNNREWFTENKTIYTNQLQEVKAFFKTIETELKKHDEIAAHKIMRIYRDVRFSKDKTPYKTKFAGGFKRATVHLRGGYWLHIEPGNSRVGGGFFAPEASDLLRIRKEFEIDDSEIRDLLNTPSFKQHYSGILGTELKTAPKGFDRNHPAIDLIRKKQFYVMKPLTDAQLSSAHSVDEIISAYKALLPFFDYMSEVLTTNLNGESIV